jgi:hypothetical protein
MQWPIGRRIPPVFNVETGLISLDEDRYGGFATNIWHTYEWAKRFFSVMGDAYVPEPSGQTITTPMMYPRNCEIH